jgi:hypothetical protein
MQCSRRDDRTAVLPRGFVAVVPGVFRRLTSTTWYNDPVGVELAADSASTTSLVIAVIGGVTALVSGVTAGVVSFMIANRQARVSREAAAAQAAAMIEVAQRASGAETFVPSSARLAAWQMHKRKLYNQVLQALRRHLAEKANDTRDGLEAACDRALLAAGPTLRDRLHDLVDDPAKMAGRAAYRELLELMVKDIDPSTKDR